MAEADAWNQPPLRGDVDLWDGDPVLRTHATASGADIGHLSRTGRRWGSEELRAHGRAAERHPPELELIDRGGRRRDEVAFHLSYHALMAEGVEAGYIALPSEAAAAGHVTHAALVYMLSQVEPGTCCPLTMSAAAVPALDADPDLAALWRPKLLSRRYDPAVLPLGAKSGATLGMAMTERPGGSDVRTNLARGVPDGDAWRLTGHKWFCSAPMSDGFLTLAQTAGGLTCFLVPRWLPEGRNAIRIERLKEKLGNRANASAEIAYEGALAHRLGAEGAGIRTIIRMVHETRLDTATAPAGLMHAALAEAHHWAAHRSAFQRRLIDQPLMRTLLADLVLDWEGAAALAFRVAEAYAQPAEAPLARVAVALAKFLNNRLCPPLVAEAMEILGGMGYVEDTPLPMLYREAPLNGIWEGSGNVICLDVLRSLSRDMDVAPALAAELDAAAGTDRRYDTALAATRDRWHGVVPEAEARAFVDRLARLMTASLLIRRAPAAVADAYIATRLGESGRVYGTTTGMDAGAILARLGDPV